MATYSAGASIKESGSLKRTTNGTTSKTLGAGEYAIVTLVFDARVNIEGQSSGSDTESNDGTSSSTTRSTLAYSAGNQFIVGGGITFSLTMVAGTGCTLTIDDCDVFHTQNYTDLDTAAIQYVVFE